ncbi:hypothetical protein L5M43_12735 [Shewanella sp. SW36]|uniref:HNH endonuclease n=1 Tax=unclassified Shewanella TaxID=196818 RepID=UPI0021D84D68|nr:MULTISPECIES: hypothetical protein [unclassified Shewanella]MCU7976118.1 hypothetical protein [Shewanella sp. SW36]MCU7988921.1 hypothetical protein [Shewanella sp. SW1]MCU8050597.1 hypothetical protein [Shewanella sp. SM43]
MPFELHYPILNRQPEDAYRNRKGEFYAASNYQSNYDKIAEDCKHRCVYCDATEIECGGERFSLDHFRPRAIFADKFNGVLVYHPYNLHLACQKCNVLKSMDWKGCLEDKDGPTYIDGKGYIDRFKSDLSMFLDVGIDGRVIAKQPDPANKSPADYMINRLLLNRPNRIYIRKKRVLEQLVKDIEKIFSDCTDDIILKSKVGNITCNQAMLRIERLEDLRKILFKIKNPNPPYV